MDYIVAMVSHVEGKVDYVGRWSFMLRVRWTMLGEGQSCWGWGGLCWAIVSHVDGEVDYIVAMVLHVERDVDYVVAKVSHVEGEVDYVVFKNI